MCWNYTTSQQGGYNIAAMSRRRCYNIVATLCVSWVVTKTSVYLKGNGYTFRGGNSLKIVFASLIRNNLQSKFDGSNNFGTIENCSRHGWFEPLRVNYGAKSGSKWR